MDFQHTPSPSVKGMQPILPGERVFHCGHLDHPELSYCNFSKAQTLRRPDGSTATGRWIIQCKDCLQVGEPPAISGDALWKDARTYIIKTHPQD